MIMVIAGHRVASAALGFVEVLIWVLAVGGVVEHLSNPAAVLAFAGGFSVGTLVGMTIEQRIAIGFRVVRVINPGRISNSHASFTSIATQLQGSKDKITTDRSRSSLCRSNERPCPNCSNSSERRPLKHFFPSSEPSGSLASARSPGTESTDSGADLSRSESSLRGLPRRKRELRPRESWLAHRPNLQAKAGLSQFPSPYEWNRIRVFAHWVGEGAGM